MFGYSFLLLPLYPVRNLEQAIVDCDGTQMALDWLARTEPAIAASVTLHGHLALFYRFVSKQNTLNTVRSFIYLPARQLCRSRGNWNFNVGIILG